MVQESKRHWQRLEQNAQKQQKVRQKVNPDQSEAADHLLIVFISPDNRIHL